MFNHFESIGLNKASVSLEFSLELKGEIIPIINAVRRGIPQQIIKMAKPMDLALLGSICKFIILVLYPKSI